MNELQIFNSEEFGDIRTVTIENEPWFVGKDVAEALGYSNASKAVSTHVGEEDRILKVLEADSQNGNVVKTQTALINESGLYALIFGSKLESAKRFKHWVTSEVLPAIRKTGAYQKPMTTDQKIQLLAQGNVELTEKIDKVDKDLQEFKADIANAGRCIMDYDRNGKIRIRVAFKPTYDTTSNGETYFSNAPTIDNLTEKNQYATCEQNFWKADGKKLFVPTDHHQDTGYISASISDESGKFDANPMLTRTLEAKYKAYGIMINFSGNLPKKIVIRTYADDVLNNTLTITSGIEQATEINYDFPEYDRLEIEFPETEPNSRIHIDYLSLGAETSYSLEYDDLYSTPVGTQLEKIKNVKVARYIYGKSSTKEDLLSETISYTGENQLYYLNEACYGYEVSINNAQNGQSVNIISSGAYYVEVAFLGIEVGDNVEVIIKGYKYNIATSYYSQTINNRGSEKEWQNPLISADDH